MKRQKFTKVYKKGRKGTKGNIMFFVVIHCIRILVQIIVLIIIINIILSGGGTKAIVLNECMVVRGAGSPWQRTDGVDVGRQGA